MAYLSGETSQPVDIDRASGRINDNVSMKEASRMISRLCTFGEDDRVALEVREVLQKSGLSISSAPPVELRADDDMATIYEKLIDPAEFIAVVVDPDFVESEFGSKFLRLISLTSLNRPEKYLTLIKVDEPAAPFDFEGIPSVRYSRKSSADWKRSLKRIVSDAQRKWNAKATH